MLHKVVVDIPNIKNIHLELDDKIAPRTVRSFLDCLPLAIPINVWGQELYTDKTSIKIGPENSKEIVDLMDVAYWPQGQAICIFLGPTPISKSNEIKPYSSVNVIGKVVDTDKSLLKNVKDGLTVTFRASR